MKIDFATSTRSGHEPGIPKLTRQARRHLGIQFAAVISLIAPSGSVPHLVDNLRATPGTHL